MYTSSPRLSETLCSMPNGRFFMRHVVMINYAGKVYTVIKGIEVIADQNIDSYVKIVFVFYTIFMTLGMYWYTRFWLEDEDLDRYYANETTHILIKYCNSNKCITLCAALYYVIFAVLFFALYSINGDLPVILSFAIWNVWCAINLVFASRDLAKD